MWFSSIHFVTYEICKFFCVNSFCLILFNRHYHYSTPTCITSAVTDIIMYFTVHLSSWWRIMKCGFYLFWRFPANWKLWTPINFQERLQHLHMLWWWKNSFLYHEGLSVSDQKWARCVIWILKCMVIRSQNMWLFMYHKYLMHLSESSNIIQNFTLPLDPILSQPILNSLWISKIFYHLTHCMMSGETSNP